ncbi:MAG TPA: S-layer homology domain-containing protein [Syntrophomonas sp.]|nr:S-layer homology domain-containing protein [Syntrophomonas sp.]
MSRRAEKRTGVFLLLVFLMVFVIVLPAWGNEIKTGSGLQVQSFEDLTDHPEAAYIEYLASQSIIKGFDDGTYRPDEGLTRAQAACLLIRAAGITPDVTLSVSFTDVPADHWARASIAAAVQAGYIKGFPDKRYHPEEQLTRAQAATLVLRLSRQSLDNADEAQFSDMNSGHWAAASATTAVEAGMMLAGSDGSQFQPEKTMTRAAMARALAVLMTEDPQLYKTDLVGVLAVTKGTVTLQKDQQEPVKVTQPTTVGIGDTIVTAGNTEAEISFEDGSGLLLKANTRLSIIESHGRAYIKQDGSAAVAVEWLKIDMTTGEVFGTVPATSEEEQENIEESIEPENTGYLQQFNRSLLAGLNPPALLAAAKSKKATPWYKTSKTKRVKVQVDMPWGVAAVRGTQFYIAQSAAGRSHITVLDGSVTADSHNLQQGQNSYQIGAGQFVEVGSSGQFTAPPRPMNQNQLRQWVEVKEWLLERAQQTQINQQLNEKDMVDNILNPPSVLQQSDLPDAINRALQEAQRLIRQNSGGGSSGGGGTILPVITRLQLPSDISLTVEAGQSYPLPTEVTAYYSDGSSRNVSVTWSPTAVDTSRVGVQTLSGTVSGFSGAVQLPVSVTAAALGEILGSYALTDRLVLDDYIYDDGVLTQDFSMNPAASLYARAGSYEIWMATTPVVEKHSLDASARVMKKLFADPERLQVVFFDENEYIVAHAGLDGSGTLVNLADRTISGTIALPEGMVAPAEGMDIMLYLYGQFCAYTAPVTIARGQSQAEYSIAVLDEAHLMPGFMPEGFQALSEPEASAGAYRHTDRIPHHHGMQPMTYSRAAYNLYFDLIGSYDENLVMSGQYSEMIDVAEGSQENIDLHIETGQIVSGTIRLPEGGAAESDLDIIIQAEMISADNQEYYYAFVPLASGQNSTAFAITVPAEASYCLYYHLGNPVNPAEPVNSHLLREGYYTTEGSSLNAEDAVVVTVAAEPAAGMDWTMSTGNLLSGSIYLTDEEAAPQDTTVYLDLSNDGFYSYAEYFLPAGSQSLEYAVVLPPSSFILWLSTDYSYMDSMTLDVSNGDLEFDLALDYWSSEGEYSPYDVTAPAVLVADGAYGLNSLYFGNEEFIWELYYHGSNRIYMKTGEGLWFDILNPQVNTVQDMIADNAYGSSLPPIDYDDSWADILSVFSRENSFGSLDIIFFSLPEGAGVNVYDAAEGGNLLGTAVCEYIDGDFVAKVELNVPEISESDLFVSFTVNQAGGQRRIPLVTLLSPLV